MMQVDTIIPGQSQIRPKPYHALMILQHPVDRYANVGITYIMLEKMGFLCMNQSAQAKEKYNDEDTIHDFEPWTNSMSTVTSISSAIFCCTIFGIAIPWSATGTEKSAWMCAALFLMTRIPFIILSFLTP